MFKSDEVIAEVKLHDSVYAYFVGYDLDKKYRWKDLTNVIINVLPEFAYGFHAGTDTDNSKLITKVIDAAKSLYKIDGFLKVSQMIQKGQKGLDDEIEDKYLKRGEFGELILHLLLRDRFNTIPLISKIYFKDSIGHTVHGFDCVHIEKESKTLWLGESKLYINPMRGLSALIKDLDEHFNCKFLEDEFSLISKKIHGIGEYSDQYDELIEDRNYWINLLNSSNYKNTLTKIKIPLICTYSSNIFQKYNDEEDSSFKEEYNNEINQLQDYFYKKLNHKWKDKLKIILILFPVMDKNELVKKLHEKITHLQKLND